MSHVTNVIITTALNDGGVVRVNDALRRQCGDRQFFKRVDQYAGGYKSVEASVWMAAFNRLSTEDISIAISSAQWDDPDCVRVFIQDQDDDYFAVWSEAVEAIRKKST